MKKLITLCAVSVAALAPTTASAADPSPSDFKNAAKFCKALKSSSGSAANFRSAIDAVTTAKVTERNAYGKCVSFYAKQTASEDAAQEKAAKTNAAKDCKAERTANPAAFATKYGSGKNGRNAYGKCVSQKAKAKKAEADREDNAQEQDRVNAAKTCKAERALNPTAFAVKYGTNDNDKNAFGKCVSTTAKKNAADRRQS